MGMFDDLIPSGGRLEVRPSRATSQFSGPISNIESGGRYDILGPVTKGDRAIGKYQVMGRNVPQWTREALGREMTPEEFRASPEAQEAVFEHRFGGYVNKYGPEGAARAWFAGEGGMNDPNRRDVLGTSVADYERKFTSQVRGARTQTQQPARPALSFDDLIPQQQTPSQTVAGRFPEEQQNPELQAELQGAARRMTTGPAQSSGSNITTDFLNQASAAAQGTTPNVSAQYGNLVSDQVFESDSGEVMYRDLGSGKVLPTDQTKHVAMRDPADGRVKVFARTADTDEGAISATGRLMMTGLAAAAPTARAALGTRAAMKPGQEVAQAAQRLDVAVPRAITTDSQAAQRVAAATRNIPLAGDPLVTASGNAVTQLGQKADEVARGFGGGTVAGSGDAARTAINQYVTGTTKARATKLYDAVDELVDNNVVAPLSRTKAAVANILAKRGEAALPPGGAVDQLKDALARPGLTYQGIKTLRTNVGEDVSRSILPAGMSQGDLKQIYSALSDDLKGAVRLSGGDKASAAFERANRYYNLASQRRESLAKIVGTDGNAPAERVFDRLVAMASGTSRADISGLAQARKAIGSDDWNEFVSGVVAQMGRSPATRGAPESLQVEGFSPERFLTAYNKMSDAGRNMLFRSGDKSGLADSLKDIAVVSSRFRELQKFSNPSGTAQTVIGGGTGASVITPLFMGDVATPLAVAGSVLTGRVLATVMARPASAASLAKWSRTYEQLVRSPTTPRLAMFELASRNLATNLKDVGVTVSARDFLKAIQGPVQGRAEDEQTEPVRERDQ